MASGVIRSKSRLVLACGALVVLGAALSMASPAVAKTAPPRNGAPTIERALTAATGAGSVFGIDDGGVISSNESNVNLAAATGANWERISLWWRQLEPTEGKYDFSSAENRLKPLINAGFLLFVYIDENPTWAANTDCGPVNPSKLAAFGKLFNELAKRYPGVRVWAAYNEVDFDYANLNRNTGGCFGARSPNDNDLNNNGKEDYKDYADMLAAGWKGVHDANAATGNNAMFAMGAMAFDNFNQNTAPSGYPGGGNGGLFNYYFAADLFKYMKNAPPLPSGEKYMDMVSFNYYNIYGPFWQAKAQGYGIQAKTKVLRKLMSDNGIEVVPLFVTETGEYSTNDWIGRKGQARCLNMTMVRGAAVNLTGIIWWTFRDFPDTAPYPQNLWKYGIVDQNLKKKPSFRALKTIAAELNGMDYIRTESNNNGLKGVEAYYFTGGGTNKYVVWGYSQPNPPQNWKPECSWPRYSNKATFQASKLRVVKYLGGVKNTSIIKDNSATDLDPTLGKIAILAGADPLIVQINPN